MIEDCAVRGLYVDCPALSHTNCPIVGTVRGVMGKDYERVYAIGGDSLEAYRTLSRSARRVLELCVDDADEEGLSHLSRAALMRQLQLGGRAVDRGVRELIDKEFLVQAGYARMAVNPQKVWVTRRDRAEAERLAVKFDQHKRGYARTLGRKQAAGRETWRKRQEAQGVGNVRMEAEDGLGADFEPPY
jgi:hypothetical protein